VGIGLNLLAETQVNFSLDGSGDGLAGAQAGPAVAALANGDFVVVYENPQAGDSLLAHFFDANGNAIGPPVSSGLLNGVVDVDPAAHVSVDPAVAATPSGGFLVARVDYLDLIAAVKAAAPDIHLHGFRPAELLDGAARGGMPLEEFLIAAREAGLGSVPGTAARVLDDEVRARMKGGPDAPVSQWVEVIETAHRAGLTSTSTIVFGHVETPAHQVAHLRLLAGLQDRTGGFTEFIAMPFVPAAASVTAPGLVGRDIPGPSGRQSLAVHAVARLMLHGHIGNIQAAWPKYGLDPSVDLLRAGANDLGGLLLDGRLAPEAGAEAGLVLTRDDIERVGRELGRQVWQRTTGYGKVAAGV
jgi:CofH subfamily radical SAM domain protein